MNRLKKCAGNLEKPVLREQYEPNNEFNSILWNQLKYLLSYIYSCIQLMSYYQEMCALDSLFR